MDFVSEWWYTATFSSFNGEYEAPAAWTVLFFTLALYKMAVSIFLYLCAFLSVTCISRRKPWTVSVFGNKSLTRMYLEVRRSEYDHWFTGYPLIFKTNFNFPTLQTPYLHHPSAFGTLGVEGGATVCKLFNFVQVLYVLDITQTKFMIVGWSYCLLLKAHKDHTIRDCP